MSKSAGPAYACSILEWMEHANPELCTAIRQNCLNPLFTPPRGGGITFLMPDKSMAKSIIQGLNGDTPMDAVNILQAHVVLKHLPEPLMWESNKGMIANRLKQEVEVKSVSPSEVTLANGAKLKPVKEFVIMPGREALDNRVNMAVYSYSHSAPMPTNGKKADMTKALGAPAPSPKKGGNYFEFTKSRAGLASVVHEKVLGSIAKNSGLNLGNSAFTRVVVSLLDWAEKSKKDLFKNLVDRLDVDPIVSFYVLLEPFKSDPQFVSSSDYEQWLESTGGICFSNNPTQRYLECYDNGAHETVLPRDEVKSAAPSAHVSELDHYKGSEGKLRLWQDHMRHTLRAPVAAFKKNPNCATLLKCCKDVAVVELGDPTIAQIQTSTFAGTSDFMYQKLNGGTSHEDLSDDPSSANQLITLQTYSCVQELYKELKNAVSSEESSDVPLKKLLHALKENVDANELRKELGL